MNGLATKQYVDAVAQGLNWIEESEAKDPNRTPQDGDAYFDSKTHNAYVYFGKNKRWSQFSSGQPPTPVITIWCPKCFETFSIFTHGLGSQNCCIDCGNKNLIEIDFHWGDLERIAKERKSSKFTKEDLVEILI